MQAIRLVVPLVSARLSVDPARLGLDAPTPAIELVECGEAWLPS